MHVADPPRLLLEHLHEDPPDRAPLFFWIDHAPERRKEIPGRVDPANGKMEGAGEGLQHLVGLPLAQKPRVDEQAGELRTDRLMDEKRRHGGIDAAAQPREHSSRPDVPTDRVHGLGQ